jgi:hypothetical protein
VLNIRGHSYRMRGLHADLRDDRLADDLKAAKGTYDRKTVGFKDLQRRLWSSMRRSLAELEQAMRGSGSPPTRPA